MLGQESQNEGLKELLLWMKQGRLESTEAEQMLAQEAKSLCPGPSLLLTQPVPVGVLLALSIPLFPDL